MTGGPVAHEPIVFGDTTGRLFPSQYQGGGGNASPNEWGIGVKASLDADATVELRFHIGVIPATGTLKLRLWGLANATSGVAKITVKDAAVSAGASPSAASLTSETQATVTWSTGNNDEYIENKITLTSTPTAGQVLVVAIAFNTSGWTLAQISTWIAKLIWE